jgi:hypothetical protein
MATHAATVADLYRVPQKAELVGRKLVVMSPTGDLPSSAAFQIAIALDSYACIAHKAFSAQDGHEGRGTRPQPEAPDRELHEQP